MTGATLRPELTELQLSSLKSSGEAKFYRACRDQLAGKYLILHSITWVQRTISGELRDGEADFVIFDPDGGFVVIEIKGGGISHDPRNDVWTSVDRNGDEHEIKDPFKQVLTEKHAILDQIKGHKDWGKYLQGRLLASHGVFFPDIEDVKGLVLPQSPREILGCRTDLDELQSWLDKLFSYWKGRESRYHSLGKPGMSIVKDLYCKEIFVKPLLKAELQEEEAIRIKLTEQQARTLRVLGHRRKAAISGGAGTGKTLLALQRAKELAEAGKKTLLLCYNQPLGDWLRTCAAGIDNLTAYNYHKLCEERIRRVKAETGRNLMTEATQSYPREDEWDVLKPFALALAAEILDEKFDAVVIDEGQDFKDEYWLSIGMLFADEANGYFYVFFDDNQLLYHLSADFPILEPPFLLTVNCRNTEVIHNLAYRFYKGDPIDPPITPGREIEYIAAANIENQATKIHALIQELLGKEGVSSSQIVVLIESRRHRALNGLLTTKPLPKPYSWSSSYHHGIEDQVAVETIYRFKGLESDIVILWGIDCLDKEADREVLYVATSRAKSGLFVVGTVATCNYIRDFELQAIA